MNNFVATLEREFSPLVRDDVGHQELRDCVMGICNVFQEMVVDAVEEKWRGEKNNVLSTRRKLVSVAQLQERIDDLNDRHSALMGHVENLADNYKSTEEYIEEAETQAQCNQAEFEERVTGWCEKIEKECEKTAKAAEQAKKGSDCSYDAIHELVGIMYDGEMIDRNQSSNVLNQVEGERKHF